MTSQGFPLTIGVIGVGHLGKHHARLLKNVPDCRLAGIYDASVKSAEAVAKEHGLEVFPSQEALLDAVEAVTIATPTVTHHTVGMAALERGVHTFVEKPLTPTIEEARDLLEASRRKGVALQVGHVERFNGAVLAVRDLVVDPRFIEVHRLSPFPDRSTDIGVILDVMIHDIDILLSLVRSRVSKIDAIGTSVITNREDIANARITFESGCVANVTASRVSYQTMRKIRIFEPDRYISVDYHKQDAVMFRKKAGVDRIESVRDIERIAPKITKTEPLKLELEAFVAACRGAEPRAATGKEGLDAIAVALEIGRQIAETGRDHKK
jgi:predicted dehydrogenase